VSYSNLLIIHKPNAVDKRFYVVIDDKENCFKMNGVTINGEIVAICPDLITATNTCLNIGEAN
jgi:hypothetical protein